VFATRVDIEQLVLLVAIMFVISVVRYEGEWQVDARLEADSDKLYLHPQYRTERDELSRPASQPPVSDPSPSGSSTASAPGCSNSSPSGSAKLHDARALDVPSLSDYPQSVLNFVLHSHKSVILSNAVADKIFGSDPLIVQKQVSEWK
jgi:hypothetical protein